MFARGIIMSGVIGPVLTDVEESGNPLAEALLKELGCPALHQLETVPYALLAGAYQKVKPQLEREGVCMDWAPHPINFTWGILRCMVSERRLPGVSADCGKRFRELSSLNFSFDRQNITREEGMSLAASLLGEKAAKELTGLLRRHILKGQRRICCFWIPCSGNRRSGIFSSGRPWEEKSGPICSIWISAGRRQDTVALFGYSLCIP